VSESAPEVSARELRQHTARLDVQGLRAVAVIVVVAFHAGLPLPGGFVGVDVFFVISGFVITGMLVRELEARGRIRFRRFYARRIKRLLPALTLVLMVTLALTFLLGSPFDGQQTTTAKTAIGTILMFANGVIFLNSGDYFATPPTNNPLLNMWSLSVEEQFYLVFPAVLAALWWLARRRTSPPRKRLVVAGIMLGALLSFGLCLGMSYGHLGYRLSDPEWFAFYSSPTRAWEFAIGGVVFLALHRSTRALPRYASTLLFWTGLAGITISCLVISEASVFPGLVVLLPVLATSLVLLSGGARPFGEQVLTNGPMVKVGDASYSWYLWHWPLIAFGVMLFPAADWAPEAAALAGLALAFVTLRYLENPIRFASRVRGWRVTVLAVGCVAVVCLTSVALLQGAKSAWGNPGIQSMMAQVSATHLWLSEGCNTAIPLGARGPECTWNREARGEPIYLVGDSMAGALSEAALGAAEAMDRPVLAGTKGACPFIGVEMSIGGRPETECNEFVKSSMDWLVTQPPSDVLLSSALGYLVIDGVTFTTDAITATSVADKTQAYLAALGRTVSRLAASGHRVTVILPPPGFPRTVMAYEAWYPSECATFEALSDIAGCGVSRTEQSVVDETQQLFADVATAVETNGGRVLDPRGELCRDGTCATNFGNDWIYLDGSHLSVSMSERLSPFLLEGLGTG
jgi:peptidoglycan/LPS O-acetylase OafA/YrhL